MMTGTALLESGEGRALVSGEEERKQQQVQRKRSKSSSFCDVVDAADAAAAADECGGDGLLLRRTRSCMRPISAKRLDIRDESGHI